MTLKGGPITQGSRTVNIGTSGGVACSTCPGGVAKGNPVNPMLGAKVQVGEVDVSLPGPLPFVISRDYSSYQTDTPAPIGLLGPGWWLPTEVSLLQTGDTLTINDSKGRSIRFAPLAPGQSAYSRSENLWVVRGGLERLNLKNELPVARLNLAWMGLHESDRCNSALFFVTSDPLGPWWVFGASSLTDEVTDNRLHLLGLNDRFGHSQRLERDAEGRIVAVQDGAGRQYSLELKKFAGVANEGANGWGTDSGVRLMAVHLTHDPHHPDLPNLPLVRYEYGPRGELVAVYGRDGSKGRAFQYHPQLLGRMTAHAYAGRPLVRYVYNEAGKVTEQLRQSALSYQFDYAEDSTTVTDSLGRVSIYYFKGKGGLRRVVKLQEADGSITQSRFDGNGRLLASIDALGRECMNCTIDQGFEAMRLFSAPSAPYAQEGTHKRILWGNNPIEQTVDTCSKTITNVALPGHSFGGTVKIKIVETNGVVSADITGSGSGNLSMVNSIAGPAIFSGLAGAAYINLNPTTGSFP